MSVAVVFIVSLRPDFHFLHLLEDAALDTTGRDRAAAFNVEHIFHRHQKGQIDRAFRDGDIIIDRCNQRHNLRFLLGVPVERLERAAFDDWNLVAGKFILREEIAHFHFNEIEQFRIVDHVDLVQEHDDRGHPDLARQENMLARLRHRTVSRGDDEDRAVHLGGAGDHVFHIIGVARAIDVRIMALVTLIFHVGGINGNAALFFFRRIIDRIVGADFSETFFGQHAGDCRSQGGFAVVDVTNRADVNVRLIAFKCFLSHLIFLGLN